MDGESGPDDPSNLQIPEIPVPELPKSNADAKAALEESSLALGVDLEKQRAKNDLSILIRKDRISKFIHVIECSFILVVGALIVAGAFTIGWHHLTPSKMHYLDPEELGSLQALLFNGAVGGAVAALAKKHVLEGK